MFNNRDFIIKEVPEYHPLSIDYKTF
jgi:hypothetical protein